MCKTQKHKHELLERSGALLQNSLSSTSGRFNWFGNGAAGGLAWLGEGRQWREEGRGPARPRPGAAAQGQGGPGRCGTVARPSFDGSSPERRGKRRGRGRMARE